MPGGLNPGPPLTPEDEYCACSTPTTKEYVRAGGAASLVSLGCAGAWLALTLLTGRMYGTPLVAVGLLQGWVIYQAAGRHRSVWLGVMAAGATVEVALLGFGLLWGLFGDTGIYRQVSLEHALMIALGGFLAWMLAGARARKESV